MNSGYDSDSASDESNAQERESWGVAQQPAQPSFQTRVVRRRAAAPSTFDLREPAPPLPASCKINLLPLPLLLSFVDAPTLALLRTLNKQLKSEASNDILWRQLLLQRWPGSGPLLDLQRQSGACTLYLQRHRLEIQDKCFFQSAFSVFVEFFSGERFLKSQLTGVQLRWLTRRVGVGEVLFVPLISLEISSGLSDLRMSMALVRKRDNRMLNLFRRLELRNVIQPWRNFNYRPNYPDCPSQFEWLPKGCFKIAFARDRRKSGVRFIKSMNIRYVLDNACAGSYPAGCYPLQQFLAECEQFGKWV